MTYEVATYALLATVVLFAAVIVTMTNEWNKSCEALDKALDMLDEIEPDMSLSDEAVRG